MENNIQRRKESEQAPPEMLPGLDISLSVWEQNVQARVNERIERAELRIFHHTIYMALSENMPEDDIASKEAFDTRVNTILELHRKANDLEDQTVPGYVRNVLQGNAILHIIFSREEYLGAATLNREKRDYYLPSIVNACQAQEWKGVITVDLIQQQEKEELMQGAPYVSSLLTIAYHLQTATRKPAIVIIDGYGEHATHDLGFQMGDALFQQDEDIGTLIVRSSLRQSTLDQGYGSIWEGKAPWVTGKESDFDIPLSDVLMRYNANRFLMFARTLDAVIMRVKQGGACCLQAPNNYGKTTALRSLSELPELRRQRTDMVFAFIDNDGVLKDLRTSANLTGEQLESTDLSMIIVDEAGREEEQGSSAKGLLERLAANGKKVVRIYPGNMTPPPSYQVIRIGEDLSNQ